MTDDLDRRMDARIARALRMLADLAKELHHWDGKYIRQAADAIDPPEPELKPCPWCQKVPGVGHDYVECQTKGCTLQGCRFSVAFWNRRAEVPHG